MTPVVRIHPWTPDELRIIAGKYPSAEEFATVLLGPRQPEPQGSCFVFDNGGNLISHCSPMVARRFAETHRIEAVDPDPATIRVWRDSTARFDRYVRHWNDWDKNGVRGFGTVEMIDDPLEKAIANALHSRYFRRLPAAEVPFAKDLLERGLLLKTVSNMAFVTAGVKGDRVELSQIAVQKPRQGVGTQIVEAVRGFADEAGLGMYVIHAKTPEFWERFDWLTPLGRNDWAALHSELTAEQGPAFR